tara:strand:- start:2062 stop:2520 length:459 start_codon:yes stop_codon:yes gene_type:complete
MPNLHKQGAMHLLVNLTRNVLFFVMVFASNVDASSLCEEEKSGMNSGKTSSSSAGSNPEEIEPSSAFAHKVTITGKSFTEVLNQFENYLGHEVVDDFITLLEVSETDEQNILIISQMLVAFQVRFFDQQDKEVTAEHIATLMTREISQEGDF